MRVIKAGGAGRVLPLSARARAQAEGFAAGMAQASEIVVRAQAHADATLAGAENELKALAVKIAGRLLGRELAVAPEAVADLVKSALAEARGRKQVVVRLHPQDVPLVKAAHPALILRPDPTLGRGDCRIDTEIGTIDGRVASQLAAIERALLK